MARKRRRRWLQARAFLLCERVEGEPGALTLHGIRHDFTLSSPFAGLTDGHAEVPVTVFVRLVNVSGRLSLPRELSLDVSSLEVSGPVWKYRFVTRAFPPGMIVDLAETIRLPPISSAGWYGIALVLDDPRRSVVARLEVYLTP